MHMDFGCYHNARCESCFAEKICLPQHGMEKEGKKNDKQIHIVMNAICDRDPFVEGSRNKHWWRQVEAGMCSAMQQKITIRTLKHRAKMLDARGVQRTSIGFFESSARGEAAYDGIKAAQRAHDEAKAAENVANLRTQQLQMLATYIDKLDSTMQRERQHYKHRSRAAGITT